LDELRELQALIEELGRQGQPDQRELMELDERIHRAVYRCTHNPFLEQTLGEYYVLALRIWHLALDRASGLDAAVQSHRRLLSAIVRGDADAAARIMRKHVGDFERAMRPALLRT